MKELQKFIEQLKVKKEAIRKMAESRATQYWERPAKWESVGLLSDIITLAELLLLKDESKQPQPPDFANTTLDEVPKVVNVQSE